jgi:hypothetical protein
MVNPFIQIFIAPRRTMIQLAENDQLHYGKYITFFLHTFTLLGWMYLSLYEELKISTPKTQLSIISLGLLWSWISLWSVSILSYQINHLFTKKNPRPFLLFRVAARWPLLLLMIIPLYKLAAFFLANLSAYMPIIIISVGLATYLYLVATMSLAYYVSLLHSLFFTSVSIIGVFIISGGLGFMGMKFVIPTFINIPTIQKNSGPSPAEQKKLEELGKLPVDQLMTLNPNNFSPFVSKAIAQAQAQVQAQSKQTGPTPEEQQQLEQLGKLSTAQLMELNPNDFSPFVRKSIAQAQAQVREKSKQTGPTPEEQQQLEQLGKLSTAQLMELNPNDFSAFVSKAIAQAQAQVQAQSKQTGLTTEEQQQLETLATLNEQDIMSLNPEDFSPAVGQAIAQQQAKLNSSANNISSNISSLIPSNSRLNPNNRPEPSEEPEDKPFNLFSPIDPYDSTPEERIKKIEGVGGLIKGLLGGM